MPTERVVDEDAAVELGDVDGAARGRAAMRAAAASRSSGMPRSLAKWLSVPRGRTPRGTPVPARGAGGAAQRAVAAADDDGVEARLAERAALPGEQTAIAAAISAAGTALGLTATPLAAKASSTRRAALPPRRAGGAGAGIEQDGDIHAAVGLCRHHVLPPKVGDELGDLSVRQPAGPVAASAAGAAWPSPRAPRRRRRRLRGLAETTGP